MNELLENELAEVVMKKQEIAKKWEKVLKVIDKEDDPWGNLDLAVLWDNQQTHNLFLIDKDSNKGSYDQFSRNSIMLIGQIWKNLLIRQIVSVQPFFGPYGVFYYLERNGNDMQMQRNAVTTVSYKLKTCWSLETAQDLHSAYEMMLFIANQMTLELDRNCLTSLRNHAGTIVEYDFNSILGDTIKEKYESIANEVTNLAKIIEMKSGRGMANWMVTSPEVSSLFETSCQGFEPVTSDLFTSSSGIQYVGKCNDIKLYKDPLFLKNQALMGFKGNHPYDSGYFYCPNVMVKLMPVVLDPDSFVPRRNLMTEGTNRMSPHGKDFYGVLKIENLLI